MGKRRKSKTTKSRTKSTKSSRESSQTNNLKPQDYFYNGSDEFTLPNGDTYVGEYCAHRNGMIWREGRGTYYTQDGHQYEGQWRDDKLIDSTPITISYPNGDVFEGTLSKNKYERDGEVIFKDGLRLSANFQANTPSGTFHVIDTMGQLWRGDSDDKQSNMIYCRPEQVFFNNIHPMRGVKKELLKEIEPIWAPERSPTFSSIDEESCAKLYVQKADLEDIIFGKKPKVNTEMDWEDSPWYKEFVQFKEMRETVLAKMQSSTRFTEDELHWYCRYTLSKKNRRELPDASTGHAIDRSLLDKFYSPEYRAGAKPYNTFYPSYYWHTQVQPEQEEETSKEYTAHMEEISEHVEEISLHECVGSVETLVNEEYTPNPCIACGTSSLYAFLRQRTGAKITNSCESVF